MDFVVVGIFVGAIIVGAGAAIRDILPRKQPRLTRQDGKSIEPDALRKAWRRFCQSAGILIMTMGLLVILSTVAAIVLSLSDRTGWILVGTSTSLAVVVLAIGAVVIPNHYRRGGFDPVYRTIERHVPPAVVSRDIERRLGTPRAESVDDLFSDALPPSANDETDDATVPDAPSDFGADPAASAETDLTDGAGISDQPPHLASNEPFAATSTDFATAVDPTDQRVINPPLDTSQTATERNPARPDATVTNTANPPRAVIQPEPSPVSEEGQGDSVGVERAEVGPARLRREREANEFESLAPPILEAPLIDPDDELPAWNAPSLPTPPPIPYIPPANRNQPAPDPATGFESSLLADLDVPAAGDVDVAGPFQSRLLNELTGEDAESTEGRADVLLEEFSLPSHDNPSGSRDANHSR